jgi:hypothetical protein
MDSSKTSLLDIYGIIGYFIHNDSVCTMNIVAAPHGGFWIKDGDKVIMWLYKMEIAEERLKELTQ